MNEVGQTPWSNALFKNKNSSDPSTIRGCGAAVTERMKQMMTLVTATNDCPIFEQPPKGSEKDRTAIIYLPSTFKDFGLSCLSITILSYSTQP